MGHSIACGLARTDIKFCLSGDFVNADLHLAIGIFRCRLIATDAAGDDFSEKYADLDAYTGIVMAGVQDNDRDIAVIDEATATRAPFERQSASGQMLEFVLQCLIEAIGLPSLQGCEQSSHSQYVEIFSIPGVPVRRAGGAC